MPEEKKNIDIIKEAAQKLVQLTDDPQTGLFTWHIAVNEQLKILSGIYNG